MNSHGFAVLNAYEQALVAEAYADGFTAAVEIVASCKMTVHDEALDKHFEHVKDMLVKILHESLRG